MVYYRLLTNLLSVGITATMLKWPFTYLSNKLQRKHYLFTTDISNIIADYTQRRKSWQTQWNIYFISM